MPVTEPFEFVGGDKHAEDPHGYFSRRQHSLSLKQHLLTMVMLPLPFVMVTGLIGFVAPEGQMSVLLVLMLAGFAFGIWRALSLTRSLEAPLEGLARTVQRLAAGDTEARVPVDAGCRELQVLQGGINELAGAMGDAHRMMQAKIEESTCHLAFEALHDPLTGLYNRRAFVRALDEVLAVPRCGFDQIALCFIDLDHFKLINDVAGHAAGDALLCQVAGLIQMRTRAQDMVCRLGGDEFVLILRGCSGDDARRIAEGLCEAIATLRFEWDGVAFAVSGSFGLTHVSDAVSGASALLGAADAACYAAKQKGRNQVVEHSSARSA